MAIGIPPENERSPFWTKISPWAILGAVVLLVSMTGVFTLTTIRHLNAHTTALLTEKGAALIRSFEAGARTGMKGMMGMRKGRFRMQFLLMETAQQNDIVYLVVTDTRGTILAHSDPERIGGIYAADVDWIKAANASEVAWRTLDTGRGQPIFEVYRRFAPINPPHPRHDSKHGHGTKKEKSARPRPRPEFNSESPSVGNGVIFVGLDTASAEAARNIGIRQALLTGGLILLVGLGAVGFLFLAQANRATRTSLFRVQAFSDHVVKHLPVGLVALDAGNRVVAYNRKAQDLIGVDASTAMGQGAQRLFGGAFEDALTQSIPRQREIQVQGPQGDGLTLAVSTSYLPGTDEGSQGRLILLQDLTQVKLLQQEVQKQERLASVGRLAAGVAHEIRNPLSSIKGFAVYFKERYQEIPRDHETAKIMIQEVDRLNRVIGQLLDLARPEMLEIRAMAPVPLVRDSLRMVVEQARQQNVTIDLNSQERLPLVVVDPDKIKQVLLNLLLNALEAMADGGRLNVNLAGKEGGQTVAIGIADTGGGIDGSQLARIYDPYYTTKPGGTGLGLAIVHKILEAHEARIEVVSEKGSGTEVTVYLPVSREDQQS